MVHRESSGGGHILDLPGYDFTVPFEIVGVTGISNGTNQECFDFL